MHFKIYGKISRDAFLIFETSLCMLEYELADFLLEQKLKWVPCSLTNIVHEPPELMPRATTNAQQCSVISQLLIKTGRQ
jgi:hypothetical protein